MKKPFMSAELRKETITYATGQYSRERGELYVTFEQWYHPTKGYRRRVLKHKWRPE